MKGVFFTAAFCFLVSTGFAQTYDENGPLTSESIVNWTRNIFSSRIALDVRKADFAFPGGKSAAMSTITVNIPSMLKDPLLSLNVDSDSQLGDLVVSRNLDLENVLRVIDSGRKSAGSFNSEGTELQVDHTLRINDIASMLIRHRITWTPKQPVERIATRVYTGILIDARGTLPVQGEFIGERAQPAFFPRVWSEDMDLLYERGMMDPELERQRSLVHYDFSSDEGGYRDLIGYNPLRVTARKIFGQNFTDPVISRADYLRILSEPRNEALLNQGRVVILLDEDQLVHKVGLPKKDREYWVHFREVGTYVVQRIPGIDAVDSHRGIQIIVDDLRFTADQATLLPAEAERLDTIARALRRFLEDDYTIRVDGHTADVGEPVGEMRLSRERAQTIVDAMTARGIPADLFTVYGHGSRSPLSDNATAAGRALNRRVEITATPRTVYVQRY